MTFQPSVFQQAIFDEIEQSTDNLFISAVAGSGKTTTILKCLDLLPKGKDIVFLAFNKSIVTELQDRVKRADVRISTMHSFGWNIIRNKYGKKAKLNDNKILGKVEKLSESVEEMTEKKKFWYFYTAKKVLDLARLNLVTSKSDLENICNMHDIFLEEEDLDFCMQTWNLIKKDFTQFDFTDMVYLPAIDDTMRVPKYDYVFVDESQDLSLAQQKIIQKMLKSDGRLICVGDPQQAIYGFAGADSNSYNRLGSLYPNTKFLPLSVCYRCASSIVNYAKDVVPHIESAPNAEEGEVRNGNLLQLRSDDWILCRNVKPLVMLNLHLLKQGIKSKVKGKDIGEGLLNMVKKVGTKSLKALILKLEHNYTKTLYNLSEKGVSKPEKHPKAIVLLQKIDLIQVLSEGLVNTDQLIDRIKDIFSDEIKGIILSTIHKSKGLENDRVFLICPELMPSPYAVHAWQIEQENNLKYVAITRARKELVVVSTDEFEVNLTQKINCEKVAKV
jgi:superfamily I DNA/RNA helicase